MPEHSSLKKDRVEITAFLGALCLFLSALEYLIPKPLPFLRLGFSNLPLIIGLSFLKPADLLRVLVLKILGQGLVNGTMLSYVFLFSTAGSVSSLLVMFALHRLGGRFISLIGVSLSGALASSVVQVLLAVSFIFGNSARVIAPLALGSSLISGLLIGIFSQRFSSSSEWFKLLKERYRGNLS